MQRKIVNPWSWQDDFGFVQAIELTGGKRTLVCSGQASQSPDGAPAHIDDMKKQTQQALQNLDAVLAQAEFAPSDIVRVHIYTTDVDLFLADGIEVWGGWLGQAGCRPTTTLLGVARLAYPELLIEFEATAVA